MNIDSKRLVAGSYSRYSTDLQDNSSLEQQKLRCQQQAEKMGLSISPEFEFSDSAVSGSKSDRQGIENLFAAVAAKKV